MKLCRLLAPDWLINESPGISRVVEGLFTMEQLKEFNEIGYHIYYLPNHPKTYQGGSVEGKDIDSFEYVFVDCDLKDGFYKSKEIESIEAHHMNIRRRTDGHHVS